MTKSSHVAARASEQPTPAQLKELFAQIESGRITKTSLQRFLRHGFELAQLFAPDGLFSLSYQLEQELGGYLETLVVCEKKLLRHTKLVSGLEGLVPRVEEKDIKIVVASQFAPFFCENSDVPSKKRGYRDILFAFDPAAIAEVRQRVLRLPTFIGCEWDTVIQSCEELGAPVDPPFREIMERTKQIEVLMETAKDLDELDKDAEEADRLSRGIVRREIWKNVLNIR
ncbi:MAG: hypothetical protein WD972_02340 [Candidatus Andersenbacteria bacterium]